MVDAGVQVVSDSVYEVTYTLTKVGVYTMQVRNANLEHLFDSQTQITCQATQADPTNTVLTGDALTDATAGIIYTFNVTLFDSGNNRLPAGGDSLTILLEPDLTSTKTEIFDNNDGSYTV